MKQPLHLAWLASLSFVQFHFGLIIEQSLNWTDHTAGLVNGLFMAIPMTIVWILVPLPWCLAAHYIFRSRGWTRFRTWIAAFPSILMLATSMFELFTHPPDPRERFQRFAHTPMPTSASGLIYHHEGGGLADYGDVYYFTCTAADGHALIDSLKVELLGGQEVDSYASFRLLPGAPDFHTWTGRRIYQRYDDKKGWFYHIVTDQTGTQLYVSLSCI